MQDLKHGCQLAQDVDAGLDELIAAKNASHDKLSELLDKASRACVLLQYHPNADTYAAILELKASLHHMLGQETLVVAALRKADDHFVIAERKGLVKAIGQGDRLRQVGRGRHDLGIKLYQAVSDGGQQALLRESVSLALPGVVRRPQNGSPWHGRLSQVTQGVGQGGQLWRGGPIAFPRKKREIFDRALGTTITAW